jgi:hypothetical protein
MMPCVGGSRKRSILADERRDDKTGQFDLLELRDQHRGLETRKWEYWEKSKLTARRSSSVTRSGDNPPWTQRNCLFMTAARGRLQNESMQAS